MAAGDRRTPRKREAFIRSARVGVEPHYCEGITTVVGKTVVGGMNSIVKNVMVELVDDDSPIDRDADGGSRGFTSERVVGECSEPGVAVGVGVHRGTFIQVISSDRKRRLRKQRSDGTEAPGRHEPVELTEVVVAIHSREIRRRYGVRRTYEIAAARRLRRRCGCRAARRDRDVAP